MSTVTTEQGAAALTNFLIGGTTSFGDASNSVWQALSAQSTYDKAINVMAATADIGGVGAGTWQMVQQFATDSTEAGALAGAIGSKATQLGVAASAGSITGTVYRTGFGSVTASQLDAFAATLLAAGATVAAPSTAIVLGTLSAVMTAFSWSKQANDSTVSNAFNSIQGTISSFFSRLSASDKATFESSLSSSINSVLNGGMMIPQVDGSGQIVGYGVDVPVSIVAQSDGSTLYTFASGMTYQAGAKAMTGTLQGAVGEMENIWTIPQVSGSLSLLADGDYSYAFTDSNKNRVAEVYIAGSGEAWSVSGGSATFINEIGSNNQLNVESASYIGIQGSGNITKAGNSTINFAGNGLTTVNGSGNRITTGYGSSLTVNGNNDYATFLGGNGSVTLFGLNNSVSASGNYVYGHDNATFSLNGSGNFVTNGNGSNTIIAGDNNNLAYIGNSGSVDLSGHNNVVNGSSAYIYGHNGVTFTINGSGDTLTNGDNSSTFINGSNNNLAYIGSSGSVDLRGQSNVITGSSDFIYGHNGVTFTVNGSRDTITNGDSSDTIVNGSNNNLAYIGGGASVDLHGQSNVVNGSGDYIYGHNGVTFTVNGSGNSVTNGDNSSTIINGNNNNLSWIGNSGSVSLFGMNNAVTGSADYIYGHDNTNFFVSGSGNTITNGSGSTTSVNGNNNNLAYVGGGSSVALFGIDNIINQADGVLNLGSGSSAVVIGSNDRVNTSINCALSQSGDNNVLTLGSGSSLFDNGINNSINASGCEIAIGSVNRNCTVYINGDNNYIDASAVSDFIHTNIVISGSNNYIVAEAITIHSNGSNNKVYGGYNNAFNTLPAGSSPSFPTIFPHIPVSPGGSGFDNDNFDDVYTYPVETPPINVTPIYGATAQNSVTSTIDLQTSILIENMAVFGPNSAGSTAFITAAQQEPQTMLAFGVR